MKDPKDHITFAAPYGWRAAMRREAQRQGQSLSAWVRGLIKSQIPDDEMATLPELRPRGRPRKPRVPELVAVLTEQLKSDLAVLSGPPRIVIQVEAPHARRWKQSGAGVLLVGQGDVEPDTDFWTRVLAAMREGWA